MFIILWAMPLREKVAMFVLLLIASIPGVALAYALIEAARAAAILWPPQMMSLC